MTARDTPTASERGSVMLSVLGVTAIVSIVAVTIATGLVAGLATSSAARASLQAQSAAEAGIDFSRAALLRGSCPSTMPLPTAPSFTLDVASRTAGGAWVSGCPASGAAEIRVVSTGLAEDIGVAGNDSGDLRRVEAVYAAAPSTAAVPVAPVAMFSYASAGFLGSSQIMAVDGSVPLVRVHTGDLSCAGSGIYNSAVTVDQGSLVFGASCQVRGDVRTAGATNLTDTAHIGGNVSAASANIGGAATVGGGIWSTGSAIVQGSAIVSGGVVATDLESAGSSIVRGDTWTSGPTSLMGSSQIFGRATASSLAQAGSSIIGGDGWSTGATSLSDTSTLLGALTTRSVTGPEHVTGAITVVPAGPGAGPPAAANPVAVLPASDWVDVGYVPGAWPGYTTMTTSIGCNGLALQVLVNLLASGPGIIDARGCAAGVSLTGSGILILQNDLVIIASTFAFADSSQIASASAQTLTLVTPDQIADGKPTCTGSRSSIAQSFIVQAPVTALLYTPCAISMGFSSQWRGGLYGGNVSMGGSSILRYLPVQFPGPQRTAPGGSSGTPSGALVGGRTSLRDLVPGG
ncbi:MAG: polymer-forming cytoskeletal protein [Burkholderiaceae bacterium]|nr:polymer-forming cytoskeletal protein [Microbacteriaceae bacterium]